MIKSLLKGILFGIGFILGAYLISIIPIENFISNGTKEFCNLIGNMLIKLGK